MTSIVKPPIRHPALKTNALGLTLRDYEGSMSTLCAGCGHDSVTAAIVQAAWELALEPHRAAKMSGIGCSSKTTAYFMKQSHGFNSVHGRMPSVASGAAAANRGLNVIGISGDGDSLSIGLGQLTHAIRRNVNMLYVIENNGVYGLTKGQFSASADIGSKLKKGEANEQPPIDPVLLALSVGATFVGRSFSGDKQQLVPILKAAISHRGLALIDVISPCVTFNNHEGSTKSYEYTREHDVAAVEADYIPVCDPIEITGLGATSSNGHADNLRVVQMHDGGTVRLRSTSPDYDPTDRASAYQHISACQRRGEIATGLLFVDNSSRSMHDVLRTTSTPLVDLQHEDLCPGSAALDSLMKRFR
ncbi:MAG: 2-oxoacid:ferredoxin oxidoreductase subunit beta [Pirellulales bacterium]